MGMNKKSTFYYLVMTSLRIRSPLNMDKSNRPSPELRRQRHSSESDSDSSSSGGSTKARHSQIR